MQRTRVLVNTQKMEYNGGELVAPMGSMESTGYDHKPGVRY
jgi:hypothetical protein